MAAMPPLNRIIPLSTSLCLVIPPGESAVVENGKLIEASPGCLFVSHLQLDWIQPIKKSLVSERD